MSAPDFAHADHKFDFIIVGSGAGGGPLAARLAQKKFRVLLIEAGPEQSATDTPVREVSLVPGLHAVSTEHPGLSWEFFVEHYDHPIGEDPKRHKAPGDPLRDGIFYPRAAGLGGCTVHNAMITVAGPDSDWEDLADFVEDDTWRGGPMREYFKRLERNEYRPPPTPPPTTLVGPRVGSDLVAGGTADGSRERTARVQRVAAHERDRHCDRPVRSATDQHAQGGALAVAKSAPRSRLDLGVDASCAGGRSRSSIRIMRERSASTPRA